MKKLYLVWQAIKTRCYNTGHRTYKYYGAKGVTVCDEWRNNFKAFFDWAMSNGYKEGLDLTLIDKKGAYSPSNCKWGDGRSDRYHLITYQGKTQTITQWAKELNINSSTISSRLFKGLSIQEALCTSYLPKKYVAKNAKSVKCVETGVIYENLTKAGNETCINSANISHACRGRRKTAGGYHWEFVETERG